MKYQIFIFNWIGQEYKVLYKINQFKKIGYNPIVINSDESLIDKYDWIHIGEQAYFTEQFNKAVSLFDGDMLFHIQGDASYDNWADLIQDSITYYKKYSYGIYAPNIDYTYWTDDKIFKKPLSHGLYEVNNTDCTCWFIHKNIIKSYIPVDTIQNKFGWNIDQYLIRISYLKKMKVIRDYNHQIIHPKHTNYDKVSASSSQQYMMTLIKNIKLDVDNDDK